MSCLLSPVRRRARSLSNRQVGGDSEDSWPVDGTVGVASSNAGSRRRGTWGCSAQTPAGIETQLLFEVLAAHCNIVHPAASSWGFPTVIRHTAGENVQPQLEALCFRRGRFRDGGVRWVMRGEAGRPGCLEYRSLFNPTWWFFFFSSVLQGCNRTNLCCRDLPHRPGQDSSASSRPSGRHQIPRDPLQRHAPCYSEDSKRRGAPGTVFRVSMCAASICMFVLNCL